MKGIPVITVFLSNIMFTYAQAASYALLMHPSTEEGGCLAEKKGEVILALKDACRLSEPTSRWEKEALEGDSFLIHYAPEKDSGKCLTLLEEKVGLQNCNQDNVRQVWKFMPNGDKITLSSNDKCLSAVRYPKGTAVDLQNCKDADDDTLWIWKDQE